MGGKERKSIEEIKNGKIEEIVEEKVEQKIGQKNKEIEKLRQKIQNLQKKEKNQTLTSNTDKKVSRRNFLKKLGLGAAGLGALSLSPTSALNIKDENLDVFTGTNNDNLQKYFSVKQGGPVQVKNTDLEIKGKTAATQNWVSNNYKNYTDSDASDAAPVKSVNGQTGDVTIDTNSSGTTSVNRPVGDTQNQDSNLTVGMKSFNSFGGNVKGVQSGTNYYEFYDNRNPFDSFENVYIDYLEYNLTVDAYYRTDEFERRNKGHPELNVEPELNGNIAGNDIYKDGGRLGEDGGEWQTSGNFNFDVDTMENIFDDRLTLEVVYDLGDNNNVYSFYYSYSFSCTVNIVTNVPHTHSF